MKGSTPSFHWALRLTAGTLWPWATTVIGEVKLSVEFECSQLGPPKAREVAPGSAVLLKQDAPLHRALLARATGPSPWAGTDEQNIAARHLSFVSLRHLQRSMASSAPVRESRSGAKMEHVDLTKPPSGDSLAVMREPRLSKIAHFS
jgi:hypothetical protein